MQKTYANLGLKECEGVGGEAILGNTILHLKKWWNNALTVLAVLSSESVAADALVAVQQRVAAASVLTNIFGAGVVGIHGHITGVKGVIRFQDWNSHEGNLGRQMFSQNY